MACIISTISRNGLLVYEDDSTTELQQQQQKNFVARILTGWCFVSNRTACTSPPPPPPARQIRTTSKTNSPIDRKYKIRWTQETATP